MEKKKSFDLLVSGFCLYCDLSLGLHEWVRSFASHQRKCKFYFGSMYGGLDTPYGSNNMNTALQVSVATRFCRVLIFASSLYLSVIYLFQ